MIPAILTILLIGAWGVGLAVAAVASPRNRRELATCAVVCFAAAASCALTVATGGGT